MKGNNGTGNNILRDDWETPQELWNDLNKQYKFGLDCCANAQNTKTEQWTNDFKLIPYKAVEETVWMNPPFSKANEMFGHFFHVIKQGICIYRCDNMETKIWQDIILENASWILIPKGRIKYERHKGSGARFPSALIGYNVEVPKHIKGKILAVKK